MKLAELKQLTLAELQTKLVEAEAEYNQKSINHAVSPLDNPAELRELRRNIARINTLITERKRNND